MPDTALADGEDNAESTACGLSVILGGRTTVQSVTLSKQRRKHPGDHHEAIAYSPVVLLGDAIRLVVRSQVTNRFLSFAARDFQRMIALSSGPAPETLRDVRSDRLRRFAQLLNMNQAPRIIVDQAIDFIRDDVRRIEYREVTMVRHGPRVQRLGGRGGTESTQ